MGTPDAEIFTVENRCVRYDFQPDTSASAVAVTVSATLRRVVFASSQAVSVSWYAAAALRAFAEVPLVGGGFDRHPEQAWCRLRLDQVVDVVVEDLGCGGLGLLDGVGGEGGLDVIAAYRRSRQIAGIGCLQSVHEQRNVATGDARRVGAVR